MIREFATIHVGTERGGGCTRLGDDNLVMNNAHVAHDCQVGSHCIITGPGGLAGHVELQDHVVLGAFTGIHQFCRVGESAMCAGNAKLRKDAPPFSLVAGDGARVVGLNVVGLRRRGFSPETIRTLKHAFHLLFNSRMRFREAVKRVREEIPDSPEVEPAARVPSRNRAAASVADGRSRPPDEPRSAPPEGAERLPAVRVACAPWRAPRVSSPVSAASRSKSPAPHAGVETGSSPSGSRG